MDDHISYVILYQLFNVSNLSLYNQARNWVAFQYLSVVSQSPSDHTTSGLYLFTISYSSGIVFVCKIKAKKLQKHYIENDRKKKFKNQKCEEKYSELKECNFFSFQSCNTYLFTFFKLKLLLLAYPDKVLCCVVVSLVFFIQGMIPLKQRVIQTKMYISLAPYRVGQFTSKIKSKKLHINQALLN